MLLSVQYRSQRALPSLKLKNDYFLKDGREPESIFSLNFCIFCLLSFSSNTVNIHISRLLLFSSFFRKKFSYIKCQFSYMKNDKQRLLFPYYVDSKLDITVANMAKFPQLSVVILLLASLHLMVNIYKRNCYPIFYLYRSISLSHMCGYTQLSFWPF